MRSTLCQYSACYHACGCAPFSAACSLGFAFAIAIFLLFSLTKRKRAHERHERWEQSDPTNKSWLDLQLAAWQEAASFHLQFWTSAFLSILTSHGLFTSWPHANLFFLLLYPRHFVLFEISRNIYKSHTVIEAAQLKPRRSLNEVCHSPNNSYVHKYSGGQLVM